MIRFISIILILGLTNDFQVSEKMLTGRYPNPENLLQKEVLEAFEIMKSEAAKDGIHLKTVSGYRSFKRQNQIWNYKYKKYAATGLGPNAIFDSITTYSAVPGTSRHHWGTEIDVIDGSKIYTGDALIAPNFHGNGPFCALNEWMEKNSSRFGFELVYTLDHNRTGFNYEPWHYSYVPLSRKRYHNYLQNIKLTSFLKKRNINGIDKIDEQQIIRYLETHFKGINPKLKG